MHRCFRHLHAALHGYSVDGVTYGVEAEEPPSSGVLGDTHGVVAASRELLERLMAFNDFMDALEMEIPRFLAAAETVDRPVLMATFEVANGARAVREEAGRAFSPRDLPHPPACLHPLTCSPTSSSTPIPSVCRCPGSRPTGSS